MRNQQSQSLNFVKLFGAVLLLVFVSTPVSKAADAVNTNSDRGQLSDSDYRFVTNAAHSSLLEIGLGEIASTRGRDPLVKQLGQLVAADHIKVNDNLKQVVAQKGAVLLPELDGDQQETMQRLHLLAGADFDQAYTQQVINADEGDLKQFQLAAREVKDPDLKKFAADTVMVIQKHLQQARQITGNAREE